MENGGVSQADGCRTRSVKMFEIDNEKLIELVELNPPIWDRTVEGYNDRIVREKCWSSMGQSMFTYSWKKLTEAEKEERVRAMKSKWRHIRDSYDKFLNMEKKGINRKRKKYVYADSLAFLNNPVKKESKTEVLKEQEENEVDDHASEVSEGVLMAKSFPMIKPLKKNKVYDFGSTLDNECSPNNDPDKLFLLSLLPDYKALSSRQKIDFRLHMIQFLKDVEDQNMPKFWTIRKASSSVKKRLVDLLSIIMGKLNDPQQVDELHTEDLVNLLKKVDFLYSKFFSLRDDLKSAAKNDADEINRIAEEEDEMINIEIDTSNVAFELSKYLQKIENQREKC